MVTRKPIVPREDGSRAPLPYPVTPTSPKQQQSYVPESDTTTTAQDYSATDSTNPWQQVDVAASTNGILGNHRSEGADLLPAPLRISKSSESLGKRAEIPDVLKPGSRDITPSSSFESYISSDIFARPANTSTPPPPSVPPPPPPASAFVSTNPYRARSAERTPQIQIQQENESSSDIWAEFAENPTPSTQHPPLKHGFDLFKSGDGPDLPAIQEVFADKVRISDSPLIDFDQAEDYRRELEASPFASTDDTAIQLDQQSGVTIGALTSLKGKEKETFPPQQENWQNENLPTVLGNSFAQPQPEEAPPIPKPQSSERTITVPEEIANRQRSETYQIKHIHWSDSSSREIRTTPVLVQNANGPCPLLALVNALTLSTPPDHVTALVETLRGKEQVTLGLLLEVIIDELITGRRRDPANELPDVGELYAFLITLHTGMNVNPRFIPTRRREENLVDGLENEMPLSAFDYQRPGTFEHTKELMLYGTFSIPLIHGWIPPRSHAAFPSIERAAQSYEDAQNLLFREEELEDKLQHSGLSHEEQQMLEDIANIKYFLSSTATQLTDHGLDAINQSLNPGSIAILFRNDHFTTLYKQPRTGQLLHLVTDAGYAEHQEIVWESLVDISGEGSEFLSGDFRSVGHNTSTTQSQSYDYSPQGDSGWTTVQRGKTIGSSPKSAAVATAMKPLPTPPENSSKSSGVSKYHEQEDADLALALQMQEDEEESARRSAAARAREDELSKKYLSQHNLATTHLDSSSPASGSNGHSGRANGDSPAQRRQSSQTVRPLLPPRRENAQAPARTNARPGVHREHDAGNDSDAPPSYEQASKTEPYHGPDPSHPDFRNNATAPQTLPTAQQAQTPTGGRPRGQSAYGLNQATSPQVTPIGGRRRSGVPSSGEVLAGVIRRRSAGTGGMDADRNGRDKDCVVM